MVSKREALNIVFDGPPAPESGRFIEVEDDFGRGVSAGKWIKRRDGLWSLRITPDDFILEQTKEGS